MKAFLRRRGPTIVVAALMFVAGGATVTTAQNLITGADIKDGSIKTADLGKGAVNTNKIGNGQVKTADLGKGAVNSKKLKNGGVGNADLANNAVNSAKIAGGGVANADLANNAVNSGKIANGGVANADLAANAVNSAKIANGGVANADLAANAVNSAKIANGGVANADLAANAVNSAKVADNTISSADILNGTIAIGDISAAAQDELSGASGSNWGINDRNVIGNGDAYLRGGPSFVHRGEPPEEFELTPAPLGVGSLGIRTGAGTDQASFGNAVDFLLDPVSELTEVSYSAYTTGENIALSDLNWPTISIEILANLDALAGVGDYSTMVFLPPATLLPGWHEFDAATLQNWFLTGAVGTTIACTQATMCTLQEVRERLDDGVVPQAIIGTVGISKGRDFAFSGAVDALRINDVVYDFEPNGVFETAP